jgi:hypothetical protein
MRWDYRDPPLVWLLVAASALESVEEWAARQRAFPPPSPELPGLAAVTAVTLLLAGAAAAAAARQQRSGWTVIALSACLLSHGLLHAVSSMLTETYSPGLLTSAIVSFPVAFLVLLRAWLQTPVRFFVAGMAAGAGLHAAVVLVATAHGW